ncbi:hypothetical protein HELRODRAFT_173932 [Helobdella robusta]|uniref:Apple domain-containing protein n=1 Tax=Helobdella robusta TaxID=6412 RepID=T1F7E2_HELRO|nr:hypothetical protein HELRODRAFT_173932 [Helobdella robusta]ESO03058.1 hypothetical protein HELRODRAFT_173932 [Helobdella robusta]
MFHYEIFVILFICSNLHLNLVCNAGCFVRRLNCKQKDECCCDEPSMQTTFNDVPSSRAFISCSWTCSNNSHCLAFNFNQNFTTCSLFSDAPLSCFRKIDGCHHMYNSDVYSLNFTVTADNKVISLYFDGVAQKLKPNWDNYKLYDSYFTHFNVNVIAIQAKNGNGSKYIVAFSDDGYIQTNTTWKCSPSTPVLDSNNNSWYDVHYDDSSWSPAIQQFTAVNFVGAMKIWSNDSINAYCRKKLCIY